VCWGREDWLPGMPSMYARAIIAPRPRDQEGVVIGMQLVAVVFKRAFLSFLIQDGDMTDRGSYTMAAVMKKSDPPVYILHGITTEEQSTSK